MSKRYTLTKQDGFDVLKVALWSGISAFVAALIYSIQATDIPAEYAILVPIANSILYAIKRFAEDRA